jgi:pyruvate kinase
MVSTSYLQFPQDVKKGELVLLDDGKLRLEVVATDGSTDRDHACAERRHPQRQQGMNLPNTQDQPALPHREGQAGPRVRAGA